MASNARFLAVSFHRFHLLESLSSCNINRNKNQLSFNNITYFVPN